MATSSQCNRSQEGRANETDGTPDRTAGSTVSDLTGLTGASDLTAMSQRLARFMFDLQADDYEAAEAMRELAWADDGIRDFWLDQAGAVVSFLRLELSA